MDHRSELGAENIRGAGLMTLAMALFALEDMFVKQAAKALPVGEVLMLFGLGGMICFAALALASGQGLWHPAVASRLMGIKAGFEITGRLGYTLGIALTPLSNASAILQATPLVVVAGAALIFRERVGTARWVAVGIGFLGVLVILRPGLDGFVPAALWTVLGLLGFAGRDLATRAAPKVLTNFQLGFYGFAALIPAGGLILAVTGGAGVPAPATLLPVLGAVLFGVTAYWALTKAMRTGEVAVVTPFRYTRLLFALVLGILVFRESLDGATLAGAALVVASGVYTLLAGARRLNP
ncbi:DMT family transporter [Rhodobacter capsulatus]|uniref:DMT family transporter n=1 Tax=Rhodobacter capsulatus TaxID=1061 RepID=UPI0003D37867|nr:DMT family transporter [Rhodobacter capsulatus]ETD87458.1 membrane protein [Rhodobacter capsulatus B6]